jgi:predicted glycosyltransferase
MRGSPPRLLAYSHDGYGLGHLRRNLRLAAGLRRQRPDVEVLLASGAKAAERLAAAHGIACIQLPPVVKAGPGRYEPAEPGATSIGAVVALRSDILAQAVADFAPDVLLADRHPRGLHRELEAALEVHRTRRPRARAVLGLRDILDKPEVIRREWEEQELTAAVAEHYDAVLCYGDQAVYDQVAEYGHPAVVADRLRYVGYLTDDLLATGAAQIRAAHARGARLAVCTLGGGQDAAGIASAFLAAMLHLREQGWRGILITGPYMADSDVKALRGHEGAADVEIIRMTTDVPSYLAAADAVFCMGGYNTTCEVLALAVPAVIVPRTTPRLEQLMRAQRLADRGLLHWLHPDGLTPRVVAGALACVADTPHDDLLEEMAGLARTGVHATARWFSELLSSPGSVPDTFPSAQEATRAIR